MWREKRACQASIYTAMVSKDTSPTGLGATNGRLLPPVLSCLVWDGPPLTHTQADIPINKYRHAWTHAKPRQACSAAVGTKRSEVRCTRRRFACTVNQLAQTEERQRVSSGSSNHRAIQLIILIKKSKKIYRYFFDPTLSKNKRAVKKIKFLTDLIS
jgi:hypothetical protein